MRTAQIRWKADELQNAAHALKSASAFVGGLRLSACCAAMEHACTEANATAPWPAAVWLMHQVEGAATEFVAAVDEYSGTGGGGAPGAGAGAASAATGAGGAGASATRTTAERVVSLEMSAFGEAGTGGLLKRIKMLETECMGGTPVSGNLVERTIALEKLF